MVVSKNFRFAYTRFVETVYAFSLFTTTALTPIVFTVCIEHLYPDSEIKFINNLMPMRYVFEIFQNSPRFTCENV